MCQKLHVTSKIHLIRNSACLLILWLRDFQVARRGVQNLWEGGFKTQTINTKYKYWYGQSRKAVCKHNQMFFCCLLFPSSILPSFKFFLFPSFLPSFLSFFVSWFLHFFASFNFNYLFSFFSLFFGSLLLLFFLLLCLIFCLA